VAKVAQKDPGLQQNLGENRANCYVLDFRMHLFQRKIDAIKYSDKALTLEKIKFKSEDQVFD